MALKAGKKGVFPFFRKQSGQTAQAGVDAMGRVWYKEAAEYELPVATPTKLGGVNPVAKTDDMTQDVGIDSTGKLFTKAGGGGASSVVVVGDYASATIALTKKSSDSQRTAITDIAPGDVVFIIDSATANIYSGFRYVYVRSGTGFSNVMKIGNDVSPQVNVTPQSNGNLWVTRTTDTWVTVVILRCAYGGYTE